jgi:hypothetical protein
MGDNQDHQLPNAGLLSPRQERKRSKKGRRSFLQKSEKVMVRKMQVPRLHPSEGRNKRGKDPDHFERKTGFLVSEGDAPADLLLGKEMSRLNWAWILLADKYAV